MRVFAAFVLSLCMAHAGARAISISPAEPVALEMIQVSTTVIGSCERVSFGGFETGTSGRSDIIISITTDGSGLQCDDVERATFTLGALPPGAYRLRTKVGSPESTPPSYDGELEFIVRPGPTSPLPRDDRPSEDLSGVWVAASEPFTGFAFINSGGVNAQGRSSRVTGLWYDYSGTQATWTVLLLDGGGFNYTGQVVRAVPSGAGPDRTVTFTPIGNATLTTISNTPRWRLAGTVDGRTFDLALERFGYVRAAWPGRVEP